MSTQISPSPEPSLDVQASAPRVPLSLSNVGVLGTERRVALGGHETLIRFDCSVELGGAQRGAHMSRFEEVVTDAIAALEPQASQLDQLAAQIAEQVRERQGARRAEVTAEARIAEDRTAPISGLATQSVATLRATASASASGTRRILGVEAQGMTACPCAQGLVQDAARERLEGEGFDAGEIERIFAAVPGATHNQRGLGTLEVGLPEGSTVTLDPTQLIRIVERSMSSEIYELMKRSDEGAVVERAHRRPRFVEDCVREALVGLIEQLPSLDDSTWVGAHQRNLETIHSHDVAASRTGLLGELRAELAGTLTGEPQHLGRAGWLAQ